MRALLVLIALVVLAAVVAISAGWWRPAFIAGSMPTVAVEGGKAPEFKANLPTVDVTTTNKTVAVPTIEVKQPADAPATANAQ